MDDFRVGSLSPYDPMPSRQRDDLGKRKRKRHPDQDPSEIEDVVSFSEPEAEEESAAGYAPQPEDDRQSWLEGGGQPQARSHAGYAG